MKNEMKLKNDFFHKSCHLEFLVIFQDLSKHKRGITKFFSLSVPVVDPKMLAGQSEFFCVLQ